MKENHFIANIKQSDFYHYFNLYIMNRYAIVFLLFLIWIIFIDESNLLLQNKLNQQIDNLNTQK